MAAYDPALRSASLQGCLIVYLLDRCESQQRSPLTMSAEFSLFDFIDISVLPCFQCFFERQKTLLFDSVNGFYLDCDSVSQKLAGSDLTLTRWTDVHTFTYFRSR